MFDLIIARLREAFPVNRIVILLTPLAATLSGIVAAWLTNHLPVIADEIKAEDLQSIFLGAAAIVAAMAWKWIDGWQKHEARVAAAASGAVLKPSPVESADTEIVNDEDLARAHRDRPGAKEPRGREQKRD